MTARPWMPPPVAGAFDLAETVRRLGAAIWFEERCFELVGGWARSGLPAGARVTLSELSLHHGWRAGELRAVLPEVPGFGADDVVGPAAPGVPATFDALDGEPGLGHAAAHARVLLAHLVTAYTFHLERASAPSDGPIARVLHRARDDVRGDWVRAEAMVQVLLGRAFASDPAGSSIGLVRGLCDEAESPLLAAGGACGRPLPRAL